jgi:SET domain-containing protein
LEAGKDLGLFAKSNIPADIVLSEYRGFLRTQNQLDELYGSGLAPYAFQVGPDLYVDASTTDAKDEKHYSLARFANECRLTDRRLASSMVPCRNNSEFLIAGEKIFLVSIVPIRAGEEIFARYGDAYWKEDESKDNEKDGNE